MAVHPDGHFLFCTRVTRVRRAFQSKSLSPREVLALLPPQRSLIVAAYSFFAQLAQDYIETLTTTTFVTSALLAISAVIVIFMIHYARSWTDYGFTLKNWHSNWRHTAQHGDLHCRPDPMKWGDSR